MFAKRVYYYNLWGLFLLFPMISFGQSIADHLVINEVFLDTMHQEISWIEIFNPTDKSITLQVLFASSIRTPNLLPIEAKRKGGIDFESHKYVIICWDKEKFQENWRVPNEIKIIDNLRFLKTGGVLRIWGVDENLKKVQDDILYGKPIADIKSECIYFLEITPNQCSYARLPNGIDTNNCLNDFVMVTPTPGEENKK